MRNTHRYQKRRYNYKPPVVELGDKTPFSDAVVTTTPDETPELECPPVRAMDVPEFRAMSVFKRIEEEPVDDTETSGQVGQASPDGED